MIKQILNGKTPVKRNAMYYFLSKFGSTCFFDLLKKEYISNFSEISLKKEVNDFWNLIFSFICCATYLTNSLYGPHGTYLSGSTFILHLKKVAKNHNPFSHFYHGGETHFLVLGQTLIYNRLYQYCLVDSKSKRLSKSFN